MSSKLQSYSPLKSNCLLKSKLPVPPTTLQSHLAEVKKNHIVLYCMQAKTMTFRIILRYGCHTVCKIILNYHVNDRIFSSTP